MTRADPDFDAAPRARRRILCVFPRYAPSFATFEYARPLAPGVTGFMPPQGLLLVAAALPPEWEVRFFDENVEAASPADFDWADAVFASGMHIQKRELHDICARAHAAGKPAALGGPSVSAAPELYPDFDYLHVGELGDATDALIGRLARDVARPAAQVAFTTVARRPMSEFPVPAYRLAAMRSYFLSNVQFSSGCPYMCEFCDIPGLYGRVPRLKSPGQLLAELDALLAEGVIGTVYFVDDNLVGDRKALLALLPHLIDWQRRNGYAVSFACEATLNIARSPDILKLMREAGFDTIFCGLETPEPEALKAIQKSHNMAVPILDAVAAINAHGMEVVCGVIMGLDTDRPDTGERILAFIEAAGVPFATMNLLQALPKTPLWERLAREGRIDEDPARESNVVFKAPYDETLAMWRDAMARAYAPEALYARFERQTRATRPNRLPRPWSRQRLSPRAVGFGLVVLARLLWRVGLRGDYRRVFWRFALRRLRERRIEPIVSTGLIAHHLILFARDAASGRGAASHYSTKRRDAPAAEACVAPATEVGKSVFARNATLS